MLRLPDRNSLIEGRMSVLKKIKFHPKKKDRRRKIKNFRFVGKAKAKPAPAKAGDGGSVIFLDRYKNPEIINHLRRE